MEASGVSPIRRMVMQAKVRVRMMTPRKVVNMILRIESREKVRAAKREKVSTREVKMMMMMNQRNLN